MSEPAPSVYSCDEVREVQRLHHDLFTDEFRKLPIREQLDRQAQRIVEAYESYEHDNGTNQGGNSE